MPLSINGADTPDAFETSVDLGWMAGHLLRRAQQRHLSAWATHGPPDLTSPQFAVLHALHHSPAIDQAGLGEQAGIDRSTLAELVARMASRGLVTRQRDKTDGRRYCLKLTPIGEQAWDAARSKVAAVQDDLLTPLDPAEQTELLRLLHQLV